MARGYDTSNVGRGGSTNPLVMPTSGGGGNPVGPSANPAAGAAGFNNPSAPRMVGGVPGVGQANPNAQMSGLAPTQQFNGANWQPSYQQYAGYNPSQYATTETANTLAGAIGSGLGLGANVRQTQNAPGSPIGPPPQNMLDFGGADMLNAGLLAERYKKYDHATADAMTRAELAMMGPRTAPNEDSQGGSMGSWSQYGGAPEGGSQNLGGGQNIGQFVGENQQPRQTPGGAVPVQPVPQQHTNGGYQNPPPQAPQQPQTPFFPGAPSQGGGQQNNFTEQRNFGGFGRAADFQQANQFAPQQQLLQMLLSGNMGNLQTRGRQENFNPGLMGNLMGQPSLLSRFNQVSGNGGLSYGPGQGRQSPFFPGTMTGMSNFMNGMQQAANPPFFPGAPGQGQGGQSGQSPQSPFFPGNPGMSIPQQGATTPFFPGMPGQGMGSGQQNPYGPFFPGAPGSQFPQGGQSIYPFFPGTPGQTF